MSAGLNAPPRGMSSTTNKNASNSRRPQNSGTDPAAPASPPGATSTPAASASASLSVVAPMVRKSSPVSTSIAAGTSSGDSGTRVATTSTFSVIVSGFGGVWLMTSLSYDQNPLASSCVSIV
jgi:hypothetical protein